MAGGLGTTRAHRRWLGMAGCVLALVGAVSLAQPPAWSPEASPEERARALWQAGYLFHELGQYEKAMELFRESISAQPTAEAHTFLGWSMSHVDRVEEAIEQCKLAIQVDPDFGNPYNDIGVYLIGLGRADEAVSWLEKAIKAPRYCCYQFPHFNLGRIHLEQGRIAEARRSFELALEHDPSYVPAQMGLELIQRQGLKDL
jgi:Tfp pilus assembly protein PilF